MLRSNLCDYSDAYILGTMTVAALEAGGWNNDTQVVLKNFAPFANCIRKINNNAGAFADFPGNSASVKFKQKITDSTGADCPKTVDIIVP